jgi:hypothetical protein
VFDLGDKMLSRHILEWGKVWLVELSAAMHNTAHVKARLSDEIRACF